MTKLKGTLVHLSLGILIFTSCALYVVHGAPGNRNFSKTSTIGELDGNTTSAFLVLKDYSNYAQVWLEETKIGWRIIVGTIVGFIGAALGSAGGSGAGGIFVPMLTLIMRFEPKSSTAISKCMIMGLSCATVFYNLKQRHPTENKSLIDYNLALLVQPMLLLGVSTGVTLNVVFANWMVTVLLIIVFLGTSTRSFFKGVEMWKKETEKKKEEAARGMISDAKEGAQPLLQGQGKKEGENGIPLLGSSIPQPRVSLAENVNWKQLTILMVVWLAFLAIQIFKIFTTSCSTAYWVFYLLQIPVAVGATFYQALMNRRRSELLQNNTEDNAPRSMTSRQLISYSFVSLLAGIIGGLLGLGGGFLLGPLFLEIGIIPQVSSATATFVMAFSSSMCAIEYYLLNRFPLLHAAYFTSVAIIASLVAQYEVKKWIARAGRASLIVFILSFIIFTSAILLGGQGIANMVYEIKHNEYMGFEDLCPHHTN